MLKKLLKNTKTKIAVSTALIVGLTLGAGELFGTWKTISPDKIKPVTQIERKVNQSKKIDYSKLTWQEAIKQANTPKEAQDYLDNYFKYDKDKSQRSLTGLFSFGKYESFKKNHLKKKGKCLDFSINPAALLSDNNYPPLILIMRNGAFAHSEFLYKSEKGFGTVGTIGKKDRFPSIENLVKSINSSRPNWPIFNKYLIVNLDENYKDKKWISGDIEIGHKIPLYFKYNKINN